MARKKKPFPILENITITDVAAEGKSLVRITTPAHDGIPEGQLVVFVPWAVPGDVVDLQIRRKKHSYAEAEVVRYRQLSPLRTTPRCQHFGVCGGCKWQQLPYEEQLRFKQQQVYDQLTRIGHLQLPKPGTTSDDGSCKYSFYGCCYGGVFCGGHPLCRSTHWLVAYQCRTFCGIIPHSTVLYRNGVGVLPSQTRLAHATVLVRRYSSFDTLAGHSRRYYLCATGFGGSTYWLPDMARTLYAHTLLLFYSPLCFGLSFVLLWCRLHHATCDGASPALTYQRIAGIGRRPQRCWI